MNKKAVRIYATSFEQPELMGELKYFPHDPLNHRSLQQLRKYTGIEKLISRTSTDFVQALAIAKFVSEAWGHNGFNSNPKKKDALTVLKLAAQGASFSCVQFASVFMQLCQSVGIPARVLGARTKHPDLGQSGNGHVTAEYFDNQLGKWVWVDPQIHAYAVRGATPLSFNELSEAVLNKKPAKIKFTERTLAYLGGEKKRLKNLEVFVRRYVFSAEVAGLYAFYTKQTGVTSICTLKAGALPTLVFQGFQRQMPLCVPSEIFDAPLNSCQLHFKTSAPKKVYSYKDLEDYKQNAHLNFATNKVSLTLTNNMPWFASYIVIINGKKKILKSNQLQLKLNKGKNEITVQAMNSYKRLGPTSSATIHFDNKYKDVKSYW